MKETVLCVIGWALAQAKQRQKSLQHWLIKKAEKLSVIFKLTVCWQWEYLEEIAKMF